MYMYDILQVDVKLIESASVGHYFPAHLPLLGTV